MTLPCAGVRPVRPEADPRAFVPPGRRLSASLLRAGDVERNQQHLIPPHQGNTSPIAAQHGDSIVNLDL